MKLAIALVLATPLLLLIPRGESEENRVDPWVATVAHRSFTVEVHAVGDLEAAHSISIVSSLPSDFGKVIYLIPDGSAVKSGDLLVRVDPAPFDDWITDLKAKIGAQLATVDETEQAVAWEKQQAEREQQTVKLELQTAEMELEKVISGDGPLEAGRLLEAVQRAAARSEELRGYLTELRALADEGFLSRGELAQTERELTEIEETHTHACLKYDTFIGYTFPMKEQRAEMALERSRMRQTEAERSAAHKIAAAIAQNEHAEHALAALQHQLSVAKLQRDATEIRAPSGGMVVLTKTYHNGQLRQPQLGDLITKNQPLIELPDLKEMVVRTRVREVDLHKVEVGTTATIRVDAYPDLKLSGRVKSIGILALADRSMSGSKAFDLVVAIEASDRRLRPGMTSQVTLHSASIDNALTIPLHALFERDGAPICYSQNNGARPIEVGLCSDQWAVITSGLDAGDRVHITLPPND